MPRYVAFLRAINVGGHVVKMDRLRKLFEDVGAGDVETVIASGNVLFSSPSKSEGALAAKLEKRLETALGYEVATFLRSPEELAAAAARRPFGAEADSHMLYVGFLRETPAAAAIRALRSCANPVDDFRVVGREVFWLCRKSFSQSVFSGNRLEKTLGAATTLRNITTVRRIAAKLASG
jgi:uncharacterized protein (DUF1697 family)